jgi:DNA-directed RNA polymerase specialized sigma24 family protein
MMIEALEVTPAANRDALAALYRLHARRLEQIVRAGVDAPRPVIEDACQFAWSRLLFHAHRIRRETVLPWLVTTAVHQAVKLIGREGRELSLETMLEREPEPPECLGAPGPEELFDHRECLADIRRLPHRQQRLVWLQVLGLTYEEMAAREACTIRTVERQLVRARRTMRLQCAA